MKNSVAFLILFILCISLLCCGQKAEDSKVLARINDYSLPLDVFQRQLTGELELDESFKLTNEARSQFLEGLIRKELLIQEAKKLELDRKDKFVRAIERYWESTLIRDLLDLKGNEIIKRTFVSEEEIESQYKEMKRSEENFPPYKEMREKIRKGLMEKKKGRMLEEWINVLRKNARIEINQELLYKN